MAQKRLRIFAGPNGSGKSTFIKDFEETTKIKLGVYVNADDIEQHLKQQHFLSLESYKLSFSTQTIQDYLKNSGFASEKLNDENLWRNFTVKESKLIVKKELSINSYIAADLAEFFRQQLVINGLSFSYETVMSDMKKVDFLQYARGQGYRIYLYYFTTKDPEVNKNRVQIRIFQKGHPVDPDIIEKRYYRSLENLKDAVLVSNRAYLFDTTKLATMIAEVTNGKKVEVMDENNVPEWFVKYLVEK